MKKYTARQRSLMKAMGDRLRIRRMAMYYDSAAEFARDLRVEAATYRQWERGQAVPPLDAMETIVRITRVDLNWLLIGLKPRKVED